MAYSKYYPNGWQSGEAGGTPITPDALNHMENGIVNSAEKGYGYGENLLAVISADDDDAFVSAITTIYQKIANKTAQIRFAWGGFYFYGSLWNSGLNDYGILKATSYKDGMNVQRICNNGAWSDWEYENPPLALGVEYRTTRRFSRAPVYQQAISLGGVASGGSATILHEIDNIDYAIQATLFDGAGTITGSATVERFTQNAVTVTLPAGIGGRTVYAVLEYTKING